MITEDEWSRAGNLGSKLQYLASLNAPDLCDRLALSICELVRQSLHEDDKDILDVMHRNARSKLSIGPRQLPYVPRRWYGENTGREVVVSTWSLIANKWNSLRTDSERTEAIGHLVAQAAYPYAAIQAGPIQERVPPAWHDKWMHGFHTFQDIAAQALVDVTGNPFRPMTLDPRWRTSTVLDLADTIYNDRLFEKMPILGDALMDAGCDSEEIINHCRSEGPHVRGCWVVDLLLGKE